MRFRRHAADRGDTGGLPLTSMIDVVFLLLIYFILTTAIVPEESKLSSALGSEETSSGAAADLLPQIVYVEMRAGSPAFRIGSRIMSTQEELLSILRELPTEGGVFIRVAGDVPVSAPAAAIQAARDAGFVKVSYVPAGS